jgi:antitoxin FitA
METICRSEGRVMPVDLSIRNVPDQIAERLQQRASAHRRSLELELLAILQDAVRATPQPMSAIDLLARVRAEGLQTPAEALAMIRADRDAGR